MWLALRYQPTSLFSLRSSLATSAGGRTLLVPTMYAVKLALVDAAFRTGEDGERIFELVRDLEVRLEPPRHAVVTNTFVKVQQEPKQRGEAAFIASVAYREFCFFDGELRIAWQLDDGSGEAGNAIEQLAPAVDYLGKRGSFVQYRRVERLEALPPSFSFPLDDPPPTAPVEVVLQHLDDLTPDATFARISTFSVESARMGRDRSLRPVAVPYRLAASSRGYTHYERSA